MSDDADTGAVGTVALFESFYAGNHCQVAASGTCNPSGNSSFVGLTRSFAIAVFIYDAFVTFEREVTCVWTAKRTGASLLFFANKWLLMMYYVVLLFQHATFLSDQVGSSLHAIVHAHPGDCAVIIISRVPVIIADMLLIYITWAKLSSRGALRDVRQPQAGSKRLSLSDILFRDGTIYFVVLFTLNCLHLILSATAILTNGSGSYVTYFTAPLTAILVSRFLIDLQEANHAVVRVDEDDPLHSSRDPYDAPSFISSLGAFINPEFAEGPHDALRSNGEEEGRSQAAASSSSA
ncbi:hypothetical protein K466DRAFT_660057 [Polyporus arcularius HHB13444]|uniref:DUF6533 domain-containing protein n=1 Tax=Polyporus arcularius HHB13444 TaxID=1314778 RepID=A0A5C3PP21_9APHY|nr:hypothetical protein K466DRAFT_660057 [Polyporus arcularius HHB13444]